MMLYQCPHSSSIFEKGQKIGPMLDFGRRQDLILPSIDSESHNLDYKQAFVVD